VQTAWTGWRHRVPRKRGASGGRLAGWCVGRAAGRLVRRAAAGRVVGRTAGRVVGRTGGWVVRQAGAGRMARISALPFTHLEAFPVRSTTGVAKPWQVQPCTLTGPPPPLPGSRPAEMALA